MQTSHLKVFGQEVKHINQHAQDQDYFSNIATANHTMCKSELILTLYKRFDILFLEQQLP